MDPRCPACGATDRSAEDRAGARAEAAALAAAMERWAGDLALAEEPARFLAALEDGAR
jgi:hypothetical protein